MNYQKEIRLLKIMGVLKYIRKTMPENLSDKLAKPTSGSQEPEDT